ncbi:MAG TPA: HEAT repeat domain-containing protein [Planctomycetota bacterium]|nr:HEAT repeat domain-containing protein [Planctomycetota bacterium]
MGMLHPIRLCLAAMCLSLAASTVPLDAQGARKGGQRPAPKGGDVKSLFDQGIYSFDEGDYDAAHAAFEAAFAQSPSSDAVADFVQRAGEAKVFRMLSSKDARLAGMARQLLESSVQAVRVRQSDPEQVRSAVSETLSSQGQDQLLLMIERANTYGRNLVPSLIPILADTDLEHRAVAINWIGRYIGMDSIPVLQAARKHPNPTVRRNIAELLGTRQLRHRVGLATLKAMAESDPTSDVKEVASRSLAAVLADVDGSGKDSSAKDYFLDNALSYYLEPHKNPFGSTFYSATVYKLEGENVVGERVADFQLSERMAQQALEEALDLDPSFHEAQVLTLCNDAQQVYEYDVNVAYYAKNEAQGDVKSLLEKQKPYVDFVLRNRLLSWPANVLYDGLGQALADGRGDVARKIVETIRATHRTGAAPESLVKALEDNNSRLVRITAAVAIAHWNPTQRTFDAGERVVSLLSEAVLTSGVRTVQKVMGNNGLSNRLAEMLDELNMESYTPHRSVEEGYEAVVNAPPDVIFADETITKSTGKAEIAPVNYFINELRKNYRTANVPVVVIVQSAKLADAKKLYESAERKVWVVPESIDRLGLNNGVFSKIFSDATDSKSEATQLARSAAEAIDYLATVPTRIPIKRSADALRKVLKSRPDEVRLPSIEALGNIKATEAAGELAAVYANEENAKPIRIAAMRSLGQVLQGQTGSSGQVLKTIVDGMRSQDLELRQASWFAFSNANPDPKTRLEMLLSMAPEAGAAAPAGEPAAEPATEPAAEPAAPSDEPAADKPASDTPAEQPAEEPAPPEEPAGGDDSK